MSNVKVAVINSSSVVSDSDVKNAAGALQTQVSRDFQPAYGRDADVAFHAADQAPADAWWLVILDNSDQAGALGYHDLTPAGLPLGKVFAASDLQYGYKWTVTASHELLEMLGDPDINLTALVQTADTAGTLYADEVADACEADEYGYLIDGVLVSDFVYPSWFMPMFDGKNVQFDHESHITRPFELLKGGYIGVFDITAGSGWTQKNAQGVPLTYDMRAKVGSRRDKRRTPRSHWISSKPNLGRVQEVRAMSIALR